MNRPSGLRLPLYYSLCWPYAKCLDLCGYRYAQQRSTESEQNFYSHLLEMVNETFPAREQGALGCNETTCLASIASFLDSVSNHLCVNSDPEANVRPHVIIVYIENFNI